MDLQIKQEAIWSSWNFRPYKYNTILHGTLCWLENLTESWTGALSLETLLKEQHRKILIFWAWVVKKLIHMQNSHAKAGEKTVTHLSQCIGLKSEQHVLYNTGNLFPKENAEFLSSRGASSYYISYYKPNEYVFISFSGLLMSILQFSHLWSSTFDLTCLIRWCFLKSIMGFSLLISSSLNAASLR